MESQSPVYFRPPTKYPYGLTEEQVREAFTIYDVKVKSEIVGQLQNEYPLFLDIIEEDDSILEVILRAIELATTKGMEMSVDHMDVLGYYRERLKEQNMQTFNVTEYGFEAGKGISGILLPDGEFIKCGNAEHYMVVEHIDFEVQKECVYFSSFLDSKDGVVSLSPFGNKTMTDAQIYWVNMNSIYLDNNQKQMYEDLR